MRPSNSLSITSYLKIKQPRQIILNYRVKIFFWRGCLIFHWSFSGLNNRVRVKIKCDKSFSRRQYLNDHLKLHEGQVNLCDQCGKTFTTKESLNTHKKLVHSDSRPFQCTIDGCDKSFKLKSQLTEHLKQVHGPKQHQCFICLKSFSRSSTLKIHMASVHDEVRHQCNKCTKSYSQLNSLQRHVKTQHPQTIKIASQKLPFQNCLWCIRKLPNFDQFIIHAKETHPKQVAGLLNLDDFK